jgi:predicted DNA-binding transcriptional regulator YafY
MQSTHLESLTQAQRERLAHIDFTLLFNGEARRSCVTDRFGVAPSVATQDFARYKELAPSNIFYDEKMRLHLKTETFTPLFIYDVVRTLATISQGFGDGFTGHLKPPMACEAPHHLNKPSLDIVAKVTEAIHKGKAVLINYISLSSGESSREIVPHTLVDNGLRWHVRAFDRKRGEFRDFVLTRIKSANLLSNAELVDSEKQQQDRQWNRFVELQLVPHPRITHRQAIELDYGMTDGVMTLEIRAATAGYLLRQWHVDCSQSHTLTGNEYQLWLSNAQALYGVSNLAIAPGYNE